MSDCRERDELHRELIEVKDSRVTLFKENERLTEENEKLKKERDEWKEAHYRDSGMPPVIPRSKP